MSSKYLRIPGYSTINYKYFLQHGRIVIRHAEETKKQRTKKKLKNVFPLFFPFSFLLAIYMLYLSTLYSISYGSAVALVLP
jgi:hypothetical protein